MLSLEKRALVQVSLRSSKTSALLVDLQVDQGCDPHAPEVKDPPAALPAHDLVTVTPELC